MFKAAEKTTEPLPTGTLEDYEDYVESAERVERFRERRDKAKAEYDEGNRAYTGIGRYGDAFTYAQEGLGIEDPDPETLDALHRKGNGETVGALWRKLQYVERQYKAAENDHHRLRDTYSRRLAQDNREFYVAEILQPLVNALHAASEALDRYDTFRRAMTRRSGGRDSWTTALSACGISVSKLRRPLTWPIDRLLDGYDELEDPR